MEPRTMLGYLKTPQAASGPGWDGVDGPGQDAQVSVPGCGAQGFREQADLWRVARLGRHMADGWGSRTRVHLVNLFIKKKLCAVLSIVNAHKYLGTFGSEKGSQISYKPQCYAIASVNAHKYLT
jgi:hypothetical protein